MSEPIIIDLSNGWNKREIEKMIDHLPCEEIDKAKMREQNRGQANIIMARIAGLDANVSPAQILGKIL